MAEAVGLAAVVKRVVGLAVVVRRVVVVSVDDDAVLATLSIGGLWPPCLPIARSYPTTSFDAIPAGPLSFHEP